MLRDILIVGTGGFVGSILRYLISISITPSKGIFPWSTFTVNILGCFLIGILWGVMDSYDWFSEELRLLLMVGFCGGFTTFSSYALESISVGKENLPLSLLYLVLSIVLGVLFIFLGHSFTRLME